MTPHHGKFVSYLRVSTKRQGESGLGVEAQRNAVTAFLNGGRWKLVEEHVEVESGKHDHNRPALHKALEACKNYGATLPSSTASAATPTSCSGSRRLASSSSPPTCRKPTRWWSA
jgi:hypothetical protein